MIKSLRTGLVLASCALLVGWPGSTAGGSEAHASDPSSSAHAAATSEFAAPTDTSAFSLTVTPTRLVISADHVGDAQPIRVKNGGPSALAITVQKRSFTARPDGTLAYEDEAPYSAAEWLSLDVTSFTLAPGASQIVTATIAVPASPEPGDHQAALVFLVPSGETKDNVRINRGIGVPAFITVAGPVDESVSLGSLHADGFAIGGPITIATELHSTGTVHRDFRGATPLQVHTADADTSFPDFTVLRGATRQITTTWEPPLFCICHPSVRIVDADGTVQVRTIRVIVVPLPRIGGLLAGLLVLMVGVRMSRRGYRANVLKAAGRLPRPVSSGDA
jgi:hypothetical protein